MLSICNNVALNYEQIKKDQQRISKIKPFIDQYNWKEIDFPLYKIDQKKFELKNKSITLNVSYVYLTISVPYEKIRHACKSKYNLKRENQVIFLMITDGEKSFSFI